MEDALKAIWTAPVNMTALLLVVCGYIESSAYGGFFGAEEEVWQGCQHQKQGCFPFTEHHLALVGWKGWATDGRSLMMMAKLKGRFNPRTGTREVTVIRTIHSIHGRARRFFLGAEGERHMGRETVVSILERVRRERGQG